MNDSGNVDPSRSSQEESGVEVQSLESAPSFLGRIGLVFSAPSKAFVGLSKKWEWLIVAAILSVLYIGATTIQRPYLQPELKKAALENLEKNKDQIPEERYKEIVAQIEEQTESGFAVTPTRILISFVATIVFASVIALFCWLTGNFFLGGKRAFWEILTVVLFVGFVGLVGDYLRGLMMVVKETSYVYAGLGILKPNPDGSFLFYFLRQIEFTTIWKLSVLCIGLGGLYQKPGARFAMALTPLWLLFVSLVALANQFTGGTIVY